MSLNRKTNCRRPPTLAGLLQRLYQSPDVYQAAMDYARDFYESAVVSIATHVTAPSDGGIPKTFTVTYELSLRNLYSDTSRLEMLAF